MNQNNLIDFYGRMSFFSLIINKEMIVKAGNIKP